MDSRLRGKGEVVRGGREVRDKMRGARPFDRLRVSGPWNTRK